MGRFVKKVNLDPKEIRYMTLADKQECMAEVDRRRKTAWLYSLFFCGGILVYIMVYSLISAMYTLSVMKLLPEIGALMFLVPVIVFVPSFFAHSMNGVCVVLTSVAYMLAGLYTIVTGSFVNAWIAPFAFAGAVVYFMLSRTCDMYYALEKEEGFPEFCDIKCMSDSAREIIERHKDDAEPTLHAMTEMAILAEKMKAEKENTSAGDNTSEKSEDNVSAEDAASDKAEDIDVHEKTADDNTITKEATIEMAENIMKENTQANKKRSRKKRKRNN